MSSDRVRVHYTVPVGFEDVDATEFEVVCPYCGEQVTIYLEPDVMGTLVQDCEVCCQPWRVDVSRDSEYRYVDVSRGDGSA